MDGDHTIEAASKATGRVLQAVFTELHDQRIDLWGALLKPNMVLSGYDGRSEGKDAGSPCSSHYRGD